MLQFKYKNNLHKTIPCLYKKEFKNEYLGMYIKCV